MKNKQLKVGDLVKDKWSSMTKIVDWKKEKYGILIDYYLPPMGIIKKIKKVNTYKTKIIDNKKKKIKYSTIVAEIDWMVANIPEINGETSKWELTHYTDFRFEMELRQLSSYQEYYKNLLRRLHKKNP